MSSRLNHFPAAMMLAVLSVLTAAAPAQDMNGGYQSSSYPESYGGVFYPAKELQALPAARAQAVAARAQMRQAESDLNNAVADVTRAFVRSDDLREAQADAHDAFEQLAKFREQALSSLKRDAMYVSLLDLRDRLTLQIEQARKDDRTTTEQLLAMAMVKLSYTATITAMESAAMSTDPRIEQSRKRLMQAAWRLSDLRIKYDEAVRSSEKVLAARKSLADARIAALANTALYDEATDVANVAMDFAYHIYDHPRPYVVNSPYYGNYYGGGYQIGYPIGYPHVWWRQNTSQQRNH